MKTLAILPSDLAWLFRFLADPDSWLMLAGLAVMWSLGSKRIEE